MTSSGAQRLLLDEMLSGTVAQQLRARGLDVASVVEDVSLVSTPDDELLAYATEQRRVLVTANIVDFVAIVNEWRSVGRTHQGVVYIAHRTFPPDRSFVGAVVDALAGLFAAGTMPAPGVETFLRRTR